LGIFVNPTVTFSLATTEETLAKTEREQLHDRGCGAVDMSLLASVLLTSETMLWTVDRNLHALADKYEVAFDPGKP